MIVSPTIDQREFRPEHGGKSIGVIAYDWQSAAPLRTVRRKRADDDMPAWSDGLFEARNISLTISRIRQEMERSPVMPEIISTRRLPPRNIRDNPLHPGAGATKTCFRADKSGRGNIEHGDAAKPAVDETINQARSSATDVDDLRFV